MQHITATYAKTSYRNMSGMQTANMCEVSETHRHFMSSVKCDFLVLLVCVFDTFP